MESPDSTEDADHARWPCARWVCETALIEAEPSWRRKDRERGMSNEAAPQRDLAAPGLTAANTDPTIELEPLVRAMVGGDAAALTELYDATVGKVVAIARAILRNVEDAEEVTCDVYTQAWQTASKFDRSRGTVLGWLQTIARSRAIDLLRQRQNRDRVFGPMALGRDLPEEWTGGNPEDCLGLFQSGTAVHAALAGLPPQRRQLVGLAFFQDMSHAEIAVATGLPIGTVKTHLRRSLQTLREALDGAPIRDDR